MVLALSATGCKSSKGGGGVDEDGGGNPTQDSGPNPPADSGADADIDGGPNGGGDATVDATPSDPDAGPNTTPDSGPDDDRDSGSDAGPGAMGIADRANVDFGLANCGGDAPASQTFKLSNTGGTTVNYTVTLSNATAFSFEGTTGATKTGIIAPGTDASITIGASAVPTSATAGVAIGATATVTTDLPAPLNSFVIPLRVTPQGAHLQLSPSQGASWAQVQAGDVSTSQPVPLTLQNTGNLVATATVTQPEEGAFSLYDNGTTTESSSLTINAATAGTPATPGSLLLTAAFAPQINGSFTSSAGLTLTGAVCDGGSAPSLTSIPFQGLATGPGLVITNTPLAALVNCGESTNLPKTTFTVTNRTPSAMTVGVATQKTDAETPFTLSQTALNLAAGASAAFDVTLKASQVPQTATPGTTLSDRIQLTPSDTTLSQAPIALTTTIQGAVLTYQNPFAPGAFNGQSNGPTSLNLTIQNSGNLPATPTFNVASPGGFFTQTGALTPAQVPSNGAAGQLGTAQIGLTFQPAVNDAATKTATLTIAAGAGDVICGALPDPLTLSGTPTTAGFALLTTPPLQFGSGTVPGAVDCPPPGNNPTMTAAPQQQVSIQNTGNRDLTWTATVDNTGSFSLLAATDMIPVGATGTITVIPAAIIFPPSLDPNIYSGNLTITTNIPGDSPHVIALQQRARGAVISAQPLSTSFGDVNVNFNSQPQDLFTITNTGNAPATLRLTATLDTTATNGPRYQLNGRNVTKMTSPRTWTETLTTDAPVTVNGVFYPVVTTPDTTDLTTSSVSTVINAITPVCQVMPSAQLVDGTGTNAVLGVTAQGGIAFRQHACGVSNLPEDPQVVIISNYGNQALDITGLALTNGNWFSAYIGSQGQTTGQVPPANFQTSTPGSAVAVVVPRRVPGVDSGSFVMNLTDTLTISSSLGGNAQAPVTRSITAPITCTQPN